MGYNNVPKSKYNDAVMRMMKPTKALTTTTMMMMVGGGGKCRLWAKGTKLEFLTSLLLV